MDVYLRLEQAYKVITDRDIDHSALFYADTDKHWLPAINGFDLKHGEKMVSIYTKTRHIRLEDGKERYVSPWSNPFLLHKINVDTESKVDTVQPNPIISHTAHRDPRPAHTIFCANTHTQT